MPYGLFDYGGTINTMGLSPIAPGDPDYGNPTSLRYTDRYPEEGNQMSTTPFPNYTLRFPEEGPIQTLTTMMVGEEEPNYNPSTLRWPEEGPINPPSGGTGGCPAGYAPAQASPPSQYRDPVLPGPRFYDAPIGEGRPIPAPMPILPTSRPRTGSSISFNPVDDRPMLARGFRTG